MGYTHPLHDYLRLAVPLLIHEMQDWPDEVRIDHGRRAVPAIGWSEGALFGGKAAQSASGIARGVAVLAYQPGGVSVAGLHFCLIARCDGQGCESGADTQVAAPRRREVAVARTMGGML